MASLRYAAWLIVMATAACNVPLETFHQGGGDSGPDAPVAKVLGQQAYIKASNTDANDLFGLVVAISGDGSTLAVSSRGDASNATGINGNAQDNSAADAGAVFVFVRAGNTWTQQAYLKASNTGAGDMFGSSLALSQDGSLLAVGAPMEDSAATGVGPSSTDDTAMNAGAAYVFARTGSTWNQQAYVKASNTRAGAMFGNSVALSSDGSTLAVGSRGESSSASGIDGVQTDTAMPGAGAVYVFTHAGAAWRQEAYVKAIAPGQGDSFGNSISLVSDGSALAVGALFEDGSSRGVSGDPSSNSCANAGAVYVYLRVNQVWNYQSYLKASNTEASDSFGSTVRFSADDSILAVGASAESSKSSGINGDQLDRYATASGAVYIFTPFLNTWVQEAFIKASNSAPNDFFAYSLALSADGSTLAVGASQEDSAATGIDGDQADNGALNSGAVYLFSRTNSVWTQARYIKASNPSAGAGFAAVALSGDGATLVVGADGESSAETGIDGNQADQSAANAGAVYVFDPR